MGGTVRETWVAKYNAITLEILQNITLDPSLYLGGLLIHKNGHVYCVQANTLHRFWYGNLLNKTSFKLPSELNSHGLVQTNGMLVTHDGLIAIKQWPYILEDMALFILRFPVIIRLSLAFLIITFTIAISTIPKKKYTAQKVAERLFISILVCISVLLLIACALIYKLSGSYDPIKFIFSGWFLKNGSGGGELKLIDPINLEIRAEIKLHERCSYARMSMTTFPNGEDVFILLGDEFSHQYRWNSNLNKLYEIPEWSKRYRSRGKGTFPGTGPSIFNQTVYYTDNTYPVGLYGRSYSIFRQTIFTEEERKDIELKSNNQIKFNDNDIFLSDPITVPNTPGFMFWSVTISPLIDNVIVWDTANSNIQSRFASNLTINWTIKSVQLDCITIAADKGHIYFSDYNKNITTGINTWFGEMFEVQDVNKYFIVGDTSNGNILANVTLSNGIGLKPSLIVPGAHNDVIIGTNTGITRLYVDKL